MAEASGIDLEPVIAEYNALRQEISRRSTDQLVCITASLATVAALAVSITRDTDLFSALLLAVPWIFGVLGIIWCDHDHGIRIIGQYIREKIEGDKCKGMINWETYVSSQHFPRSPTFGKMGSVLPWIYFVVPSVVAMFAACWWRYTKLPFGLWLTLVILGLVPLLLMAYFLSSSIRKEGRAGVEERSRQVSQ